MSAERLTELALLFALGYGRGGGVQGLVDDGIVEGCASLVECRVQECRGEDRHSRWQWEVTQEKQLFCQYCRPYGTSARSESRQERSRLPRAGTAWLPTKARAFDPDERILLKLACAKGWRASRNPETVESHQSSQDIVSLMPARDDSRPVSTE